MKIELNASIIHAAGPKKITASHVFLVKQLLGTSKTIKTTTTVCRIKLPNKGVIITVNAFISLYMI